MLRRGAVQGYADCDIRPWPGEGAAKKNGRRPNRVTATLKVVKELRPPCTEIIICTVLRTRGGQQLGASRPACCASAGTAAERKGSGRPSIPVHREGASVTYKDTAIRRARDRERFHKRIAERRAAGMCPRCGQTERARYWRVKAVGLLHGGKPVARKRKSTRIASRNHRRVRLDANLCAPCGRRPPVEGGSTYGPFREAR